MPTALSLRRDAELRYDGPIPAEVLAAIAAEEQRERDAQLMSQMSEPQRLRFRAAKEFRLAKRSFRVLCAMTRRHTLRRPDAAWFAQRDRARMEAETHLEAWRMLRWRERKACLMSRSTYEQVHDGEWWLFQEGRSNRRCKIACCDCGLVHVFKIRIRKGRVEMQVNRLPHATGGRRASMAAEKRRG